MAIVVPARGLKGMISELAAVSDRLEELQTEAQAAFDEKSERWQEGERGDLANEELSALEDVLGLLEEARSVLEGLGQ